MISHILSPGDIFLDIGANVGAYSLKAVLAVGAGGRVVSFQPNPRIRAQLAQHFGLNGTGGRRQDRYGFFADRACGMFLFTYDVFSRSLTFNRIDQAAIKSDFENLVAIPLEKIKALTDGCRIIDYAN